MNGPGINYFGRIHSVAQYSTRTEYTKQSANEWIRPHMSHLIFYNIILEWKYSIIFDMLGGERVESSNKKIISKTSPLSLFVHTLSR